MAGGSGSTLTTERIGVSYFGSDPRSSQLLQAAHELGINSVTEITVTDLVFVRGDLSSSNRELISSLLVDPLLQVGTWGSEIDASNNKTPDTFVETALHPGVTDSTTDELTRLAKRMNMSITGFASGKRFAIRGSLSSADLQRLITSLLGNPIIERWSTDESIVPSFVENDDDIYFADAMRGACAKLPVESVAITATTTDAELAQINRARGLALDPIEMQAIRDHFVGRARQPTDVELETIAQTWSEHCAHKTFRAAITTDDGVTHQSLINQLRETTEAIGAEFVRSAFVGNAGIISFTQGRTLALKCETHNHPSAIEPFGGANTGLGGVIRDVMGAAHQPVACTNILCFGPADTDPLTLPSGVFPPLRTRDGVISGIADYGNKIGLPTVAGAVLYDKGYVANPLVYAGCIGVSESYTDQVPPQQHDRVIVLGGRTGRDGLRGATFSSMTMDATTGDVSGASVQIGDPITEKLLIELLADARCLYRAITDCGAGGLSSAIGEMSDGVGADVELAHAPLKYPGLAAWEIWLSEAQERMVLAVAPSNCAALKKLCAQHGVEYTDLGEFTGDGQLTVRFNGEPVLSLDTHFLHSGRPQRQMRAEMPTPDRTPLSFAPTWLTNMPLGEVLLALLSHPNIASKAKVIHRYDHEIRGATAVRNLVGEFGDGHGDGVVIAEPVDDFGFAVGIGVNPWYGALDPQRMALAVIDEAIRNVVAVGADPDRVALLDNFSWGDPRRASTLGELLAAVDGCCEGAKAFGAPFVSGKDSLNNEYMGDDGERHSVPPTLVITSVAHVPDVSRTVTADLKSAGNTLLLLGNTNAEFGGSHAALIFDPARATNNQTQSKLSSCGPVPQFDGAAPARYRALHAAMQLGLIKSCHDCSEGGVGVTIAEMVIAGRIGARIDLGSGTSSDAATLMFSESLGRFVVEVAPGDVAAVHSMIADCAVVGTTTTQQQLVLPDGAVIEIAELLRAWSAHS